MLPAAYGDALIVEYGRPNDLHRILIDGGPAYSYAEGLGAALTRLPENQREFELLVVSHIDADHIEGGIMVMRHGLARFKDIWFNGWKHLEPERGAVQGEMLDALIPPALWNVAFRGQAVAIPDTGDLPVVELDGGARLTLLSPGREQLRRLRKAWTTELAKRELTPGDAEAALQLLDERTELLPPTRGGPKVLGGDAAPANGSSIAFLLEVGPRAVLLGADAHAPVLAGALRRLAEARGTSAIRLDAFKLPHHGSASNVSEELFQRIDCSRFLVSTNGAKFKHPDKEAIELIGRAFGSTTARPQVVFNYRSSTTNRWLDPGAQAEANIVARFPPETSSSMVVEL